MRVLRDLSGLVWRALRFVGRAHNLGLGGPLRLFRQILRLAGKGLSLVGRIMRLVGTSEDLLEVS